jgi:hypothetical protein
MIENLKKPRKETFLTKSKKLLSKKTKKKMKNKINFSK